MALGLISALLSGCAAGTAATIEFSSLQRPSSPNNFLACPGGFCKSADMVSPAFAISAEHLTEAAKRAIAVQERTVLELEEYPRRQLVFLQRSATLNFPDRIWIEIVGQGPEHSTLAIYSQSLYGYSDFGVNKARVLAWLKAIEAAADGMPTGGG